MRLIVTGGAGYIGSVVTQQLLDEGHQVTVVDDLSTGHQDAVPADAELIIDDVANLAQHLNSNAGVDGLIHFAAKSLVGESATDPHKYWHNNVSGSLAVLEAVRAAGVPRVVFSSTAATYGQPTTTPITEDVPTQPTNTYGASKLAVDHMLTSYAAAYGISCVSLRYFNVAGAAGGRGERHDPETHLIPIALQVAAGQRAVLDVYGDDYPTPDGTCIRDYIHVEDLGRAHLLALHHASGGRHDIINLGTGTGFSVLQMIEAVRAVTGHPLPVRIAPRRTGDPATLVASNERARNQLGWSPAKSDLKTMVADAWALVDPSRT